MRIAVVRRMRLVTAAAAARVGDGLVVAVDDAVDRAEGAEARGVRLAGPGEDVRAGGGGQGRGKADADLHAHDATHLQHRQHAAVDGEDLPVHVVGGGGDEEEQRADEVVHAAPATRGRAGADPRVELLVGDQRLRSARSRCSPGPGR